MVRVYCLYGEYEDTTMGGMNGIHTRASAEALAGSAPWGWVAAAESLRFGKGEMLRTVYFRNK